MHAKNVIFSAFSGHQFTKWGVLQTFPPFDEGLVKLYKIKPLALMIIFFRKFLLCRKFNRIGSYGYKVIYFCILRYLILELTWKIAFNFENNVISLLQSGL